MENQIYGKIDRIVLKGAPNTRDLGGIPAEGGRRIKKKKLIRSGDLHEITARDRQVLTEEYGLRKVIDFRTQEERRQRPDQVMEAAEYLHIPILDETTLGITREKEADRDMLGQMLSMLQGEQNCRTAAEGYMRQLHSSFLQQEFARREYRRFFEELLKETSGSILWHCTAGKDRVGIGTMLLLEALGTDRRIIMEDYLKVNEFSRSVVEIQSRIAFERTGRREAEELVKKLFSVEPSYLEAVYAEVERDFGSMEAFLENEMGLDPEKKERLKELYLES